MLEEVDLSTESGLEEPRRRIWTPRPHLVAALAMILSIPAIWHFLDGQLSSSSALVYFLIALIFSWVALIVIGTIIATYVRPILEAEEERRRQIEEAALNEDDDLENLRDYAAGTPMGPGAIDVDAQDEDDIAEGGETLE